MYIYIYKYIHGPEVYTHLLQSNSSSLMNVCIYWNTNRRYIMYVYWNASMYTYVLVGSWNLKLDGPQKWFKDILRTAFETISRESGRITRPTRTFLTKHHIHKKKHDLEWTVCHVQIGSNVTSLADWRFPPCQAMSSTGSDNLVKTVKISGSNPE